MLVIGLTGSFGTGKTYVASIFKDLGAKIIDSDCIAHDCIKKGTIGYRRVVRAFGGSILQADDEIDRRELGKKVFSNEKARRKLERIVHPLVIRGMKAQVKTYSKKDVVILDTPLLIEAGLAGLADELIVVKSSIKKQIERCVRNFGLSRAEVCSRINSQMKLVNKIELADFVIDNNGTKQKTRSQVMQIWRKIWK